MPEPEPMSELMVLIQRYLDRHKVTDAAFSRNIGASPQAVSKWRTKPTTFPDADHLREVARVTETPYLLVLDAALVAAGYRESLVDDLPSLRVKIARYIRSARDGWRDINELLAQAFVVDASDNLDIHPGMTTAEIDGVINDLIAADDRLKYANDTIYDRELLHERIGEMSWEMEHQEGDSPNDPEGSDGPTIWPADPGEESGVGGDKQSS